LGEQVASELITLVDDGCDADGLPSGFDAEGNVRRRTPLLERGVLTGVDRGGHFAALEEPTLLTTDIQAFFQTVR